MTVLHPLAWQLPLPQSGVKVMTDFTFDLLISPATDWVRPQAPLPKLPCRTSSSCTVELLPQARIRRVLQTPPTGRDPGTRPPLHLLPPEPPAQVPAALLMLQDRLATQADLDRLTRWADQSPMTFNTEKCPRGVGLSSLEK